jgi:hypothetical protein
VAFAITVLELALPSAAGADLRVSGDLWQGPIMAGDRVVWLEQTCLIACGPDEVDCNQEYSYRLKLGGGGRRARALDEGRTGCASSGPSGANSDVVFDASAGWLALGAYSSSSDEFSEKASAKLSVGPIEGPQAELLRCRNHGAATNLNFALDADLIAYEPNPCDEGTSVAIRDLRTADTRTLEPAGTGWIGEFALAAPLLAIGRGKELHVYDTTSLAEVYATTAPDGLLSIDLASDGRMAAVAWGRRARFPCGPGQLWLFRPDRTAGELQDIRPCGDVRLVPDGMVYMTGDNRPRSLVLARAGQEPRVLVDFGVVSAHHDFDANDANAVYALRTCSGATSIRLVSLAGTGMVGSAKCPFAAYGGTIGVTPAGRLAIRMRCPRGCDGLLAIRNRRGLLAGRPFQLSPRRGAVPFRFRLRHLGRVLMRRAGSVSARLKITTFDRAHRRRRTARRVQLELSPASGVPRSGEQVFLTGPSVASRGKRARDICFIEGLYVSEVTGEPGIVIAAGDGCPRRYHPIPVSPGQALRVLTAPEATAVTILVGRREGGASARCARTGPRRWACPMPPAEQAIKRIRLRLAYPEASSEWLVAIAVRPSR